MTTTLTIDLPVHFQRGGRGNRKELRSGMEATPRHGSKEAHFR
jgi:hypothetical protein